MKKQFLALIIASMFLSSCVHFDNKKEGGIVTSVTTSTTGKGNCNYVVEYDGEHMHVVDDCGKWKVGDTLFLTALGPSGASDERPTMIEGCTIVYRYPNIPESINLSNALINKYWGRMGLDSIVITYNYQNRAR